MKMVHKVPCLNKKNFIYQGYIIIKLAPFSTASLLRY